MALDITAIRRDFPMISNPFNGERLFYFDNAATTQKPKQMIEAVNSFYTLKNSNVGRGYYSLSILADELYEEVREATRSFINARHQSEVVFTGGTTDSINFVAATFGRDVVGEGDEILVTHMEHHSNLLPWIHLAQGKKAFLKVIPVDDNGDLDLATVDGMLTERTKILAITHISNVLGTVNPIKLLVAKAHRVGVPVVVDGAQAVAHHKVDVQDLDCDFYCFSAHKMYGPMGIGVLYGKESRLESLSPYRSGGGIVREVSYEGMKLKPLPHRLEAGTPNVAAAAGLLAAIRYLEGIGIEEVARYEEGLTRYASEALQIVPGIEIFGNPDTRSSIISFALSGIHPYDVGNHANKHNITLRTGVHCAIPLIDRLNVIGTVRASFALYNTVDEIDYLCTTLQFAEKGDWTINRPTQR